MANFDYIALDAKGEETTGSIKANDEADAISQLRKSGLYPTQVVAAGKGGVSSGAKKRVKKGQRGKKSSIGGKVNGKILMIFTRQLATLVDAGLPLLRGLSVLGKQEKNRVMAGTINHLADSVAGGSTFSESLGQHPKVFDKLYVNMVKAGELGGVLELVLIRLAEYSEKAQKLKNRIVAAMVYPIIVIVIAVGILVFLMAVIVPRFERIFAEMLGDKPLPAITQVVINMSRWIQASSVEERYFSVHENPRNTCDEWCSDSSGPQYHERYGWQRHCFGRDRQGPRSGQRGGVRCRPS